MPLCMNGTVTPYMYGATLSEFPKISEKIYN